MRTTFEELGLLNCQTCDNSQCSGTAYHIKDMEEKHITIAYLEGEDEPYNVFWSSNGSTYDDEKDEWFSNEEETVKFLETTFRNFNCF